MKPQFLKSLIIVLMLLASVSAKAQSVSKVNAYTSAATVDLPETAGALRIPQMREAERLALATPTKGRLVFQTDGAQPGFWYNAGTRSAPIWTFLDPSTRTAGNGPKPAGS